MKQNIKKDTGRKIKTEEGWTVNRDIRRCTGRDAGQNIEQNAEQGIGQDIERRVGRNKRPKAKQEEKYCAERGIEASVKHKINSEKKQGARQVTERNSGDGNKTSQVKEPQNSFLEKEKTGVLMRKYALPCIISLLVGALYNIVDQIFIANASYLGSFGNAANTVVFPLTVIALAVATMLGDGCCAYVSICLGAADKESAEKSIGSAIVLTVLSAVIITAVYLIFSDSILYAFGAAVNHETLTLSKEYFFWITLGIPFYMFGQTLNSVIRSDGSPRFAMISLLVGAVTNIILDPIFIFIFKWGMMGAAVATVIGQVFSALLSVWYFFHMKSVKLGKSSFRLCKRVIKKIIPLGASGFLAQISIVFSMAAVLNMCKKYGALDPIFGKEEYAQIPTAVVGIVMKFFQIIISISIGMSAGCIPIVGYNVGVEKFSRVKEVMKKLILGEAVVGIIAFIIFEGFLIYL